MDAVRRRPVLPDLATRLFNSAFPISARDARSTEYKVGVRMALDYRVNSRPTSCPYKIGTAQADAYFAGISEGHALWRTHIELSSSSTGAGHGPR